MSSTDVLGIDPGVSGAVAVVTPAGDLIDVFDMPILRDGAKGRATVNAPLAFDRIARLWSVALGVEITPRPAALMLALMKAARLMEDENQADGWADLAGYSVIGNAIGEDEK